MKRGNTEGGNSGGGGFSEEKPLPRAPSRRDVRWGRFWGRGRFSKRSASPPDPLSRRVAAVRVVFSSIQYAAVSWSVVSCCLVVVTAADRAAATYATWGTNPSTPHVRGGSVSRRGLTQAARNRALVSGGTKPAEAAQLKRQPLFGREREGGASLREAASLAVLPRPFHLFGREREGGTSLREAASLAVPPYFLTLPPTSPARWRRCAYFS